VFGRFKSFDHSILSFFYTTSTSTMSTPAKSIRVPIGKRAYFMGNLIPPTPSNNSQTITIDKNGFHEIREDLDGEKTSNTTTKTTSNPTKNITKTNSKSKISESEKSDESLFARLEELERQEQAQSSTKISKPLPSKTSKLVRDNSAEVNALETRIAQIKAQDDYDENDALMKELKQFRKRHRAILKNPSKSLPADEQYLQKLSEVPTPYRLFQKECSREWKKQPVRDRFEAISAAKIEAIEDEQKEELLTRKIYIKTYRRGASVSGLDNGFDNYEVRGPVVKIVYFTEKELENLKAKGLKTKFRDGTPLLYKDLTCAGGGGASYSKEKSKKYNTISYYGATILEDYDGYVGEYTRYRSTFGKVWYSPVEADPRPPSDPEAGKTFAELHGGIEGV